MIADDTEPPSFVTVALDVGSVEAGIPRRADVVGAVTDEDPGAVARAGSLKCPLDRRGIGLPARLGRTADHGIEPIRDIELRKHRLG